MKKKVILNIISLFILVIICITHIFSEITQNYPGALYPALMLFPVIYITYLSKKHLLLTKDDVAEYPKLKLLYCSTTVFSVLLLCLIAVRIITKRG
jgi:hypothetical protein